MYCGPIRHRMSEPSGTQLLSREVVVHSTSHTALAGEHIQEIFRGLVANADRTKSICDDVATSARDERNSLVLTRWTEHLDALVAELAERGLAPLVLQGGMGKKARRAIVDQLAQPGQTGTVLVATASFLGEGFDCPALDTMFSPFPSSSKAASSSTSVGSCARLRARQESSCTTTSMLRSRSSRTCTANGSADMPASASVRRSDRWRSADVHSRVQRQRNSAGRLWRASRTNPPRIPVRTVAVCLSICLSICQSICQSIYVDRLGCQSGCRRGTFQAPFSGSTWIYSALSEGLEPPSF